MLYGANVPTGLLAMYSKLPDARQRRQIALDAGSHGLRQARLDVGGQWGDGRWLWRLAGLGSRDGSQMDHVRERRWTLAPSLTLRPDGPGGRTSFTLHAMLRHADAPGGGGPAWLPPEGTVWPNPHGRIPLGRFLGELDYDHFSGRTRHLGYVLHTRLSERWALRHRLRHARTDNHMRSVNQDFGGIHADLRHVGRSVGQTREDTRALSSDTQLFGRFNWGPVRHQLLLGWDTRRERSDFERLSGGRAAPLDLFQPIYGQPWQLPTRRYATQPTASQTGLYLQDQLRLGQWVATLGLRHDRLRLGQAGAPASPTSRYRATTGRLGLSWLMGNGWAPYLAYAQGFEPVAGQDRHGRLFQPSRSQQWELGLRYQPEDRNLTLSASLFALRQHKALTRDPDPTESPICGRACQVQQGRRSTRGLELEARAQLGAQVHLNASYAYTHARITHSHIPGEAGSAVPDVPRHQAALWLDWRIAQGPLAGLTLYGGTRHTGQRAWHGRPGQHLPAHTLLDAGLDYDLGQAHAALAGYHFALSVKNIANRAHVASCYGPTVCYWGQGRSAQASLRYQW
ncbi:TonB-dependent siderophore receptor [Vandammella animalimorsus]|uniref:TonB-dependent siderophore receptor n=1 Tax=Vandammella animalimorsus TaxID=2029117 RepID=UPI001557D8DB|nr:TonB-dependent siderophore receptor [Vandammella animalimorsus]